MESLTTRKRTVLALAATIALCSSFPMAPKAFSETISLGTVAPGPTYWPLYVGQELKMFENNGVSVDVISSGGSTAQQLVVNAVNIACSGFPDFMRATYQGAHIKLFMNAIASPPYTVFAKPAIKSAAELKGKTISIGDVHDVTLIYVDSLLASAGLKQQDVDFVYAKAAGDRFAALAAGAVDATIVNPPSSFQAAALGFSNVGDISTLMQDFPFTIWAVNTDWAAQHRKDVVGFVKAYLAATAWLYDPKNKDQAISILEKYAKVKPKDAVSSYNYMVTKMHVYSASGAISDAGFAKMGNALVSLGDVKPPVPPNAFFADPSYLLAAKAQ